MRAATLRQEYLNYWKILQHSRTPIANLGVKNVVFFKLSYYCLSWLKNKNGKSRKRRQKVRLDKKKLYLPFFFGKRQKVPRKPSHSRTFLLYIVFASSGGLSLYPQILQYYTMILQRTRIMVGDAGFDSGTSAPRNVLQMSQHISKDKTLPQKCTIHYKPGQLNCTLAT